jgi:membrane associated rhomboid family serine protease
MEKLFSNLDSEQADLCVLILSASGIACKPGREEAGWGVWVRAEDHPTAIEKISQYFRENPERPPPPAPPPLGTHRTWTGIGAALLPAIFHGAAAWHGVSRTLVNRFGAVSDRIMEGEVYRTVTALMLHSGAVHLMGNMVGIALFGTAVCGVTRPGIGWLMILLTGALGNLANAALQHPGHRSIGASTAVFGAIGLLSAFQFWQKYRRPGHRLKAWLPLAAGLALLGLLGSSGERTDLMAHLFGLLAGLLLGTPYILFIHRPLPDRYQKAAWCITGGILILAWLQG